MSTENKIGPERWGRSHWSVFAYIETRIVDHCGEPNHRHMRCDPARHPLMGHAGSIGAPSPTQLKNNMLLADHDDWDCVDDLEAAGLVVVHGTGMYPRYVLTPKGHEIAGLLRAHKGQGGSFANFTWEPLHENSEGDTP